MWRYCWRCCCCALLIVIANWQINGKKTKRDDAWMKSKHDQLCHVEQTIFGRQADTQYLHYSEP